MRVLTIQVPSRSHEPYGSLMLFEDAAAVEKALGANAWSVAREAIENPGSVHELFVGDEKVIVTYREILTAAPHSSDADAALMQLASCPHCGADALGATMRPIGGGDGWRRCGSCGNNIYAS